ncbi:MAG TPA: hypothetical protein VE650_21055 [Acetobacteraceae bacterium]|nr:hypothetical protein [Acetobacteraceae bacterium]
MVEFESALIAPRRGQEAAVAARLGRELPAMGRFTEADGMRLIRTAPHQVLAMREGTGLFAGLEAALAGVAGVFDLSDARVGLVMTGERLRRLAPVDLRALGPGGCAQTLVEQLGVLILQRDATTYEVHCPASYRASFERALGGH